MAYGHGLSDICLIIKPNTVIRQGCGLTSAVRIADSVISIESWLYATCKIVTNVY